MTLRDDALAIWRAGVDAVESSHLVRSAVRLTDDRLLVGSSETSLSSLDHIEVVGAGKAGAGMVRGLLTALTGLPSHVTLSGWVNVPGDCVTHTPPVMLHEGRPAGINEPRPDGVAGTQEILRRVQQLDERSLCIVLLSGGGSALLPAPAAGITLDDKLTVTRLLARSGAPIEHLNIVRGQLSRVKGGGLLRHCHAGKLAGLIISDVVGDPIDLIASGPTVPNSYTPDDALRILKDFGTDVPQAILDCLSAPGADPMEPMCEFSNDIIGSNTISVGAAAAEASRRGFRVVDLGSKNTGEAADFGLTLFDRLRLEHETASSPVCLLAGGETTVTLNPASVSAKGGRNQEVILSAVAGNPRPDDWHGIALVSGGTDGEDGPTDAAGAVADADLVQTMLSSQLNPQDYLRTNNSYRFFDQVNGLIRTGPTHTNVMDLAVGLIR